MLVSIAFIARQHECDRAAGQAKAAKVAVAGYGACKKTPDKKGGKKKSGQDKDKKDCHVARNQ